MATTPEFVALGENNNCSASSHLVLQTLLVPHHPVTLKETLELISGCRTLGFLMNRQGFCVFTLDMVAPLLMPPPHLLGYTLVFSLCAWMQRTMLNLSQKPLKFEGEPVKIVGTVGCNFGTSMSIKYSKIPESTVQRQSQLRNIYGWTHTQRWGPRGPLRECEHVHPGR